jgi:hypothetical protein
LTLLLTCGAAAVAADNKLILKPTAVNPKLIGFPATLRGVTDKLSGLRNRSQTRQSRADLSDDLI